MVKRNTATMSAVRTLRTRIIDVRRDQSGQTTVEYILLISILAGIFQLVMRGLADGRIGEALMKPLTKDFAMTYKYGHPKARGFDEGGPEYHPRVVGGSSNFRIFINPGKI